MKQTLTPGKRIFFAGDRITVKLEGIDPAKSGKAVLRTTLGREAVHRREIICETENNQPAAGLDWTDIELLRNGSTASITLGLPEVGIFEAKCCFIPDDDSPVQWADGENFFIKVEPAASLCGNSIYSAFIRQFGKDMCKAHSTLPESAEKLLDDAGYTVIPPGGTFRNCIARLDHIFDTLNCRILQLLPIHPQPTQYGRMGRYGSPFAALDYFEVDPALADFDESATPMEQFVELIDAVHSRRGRIFMDIPVNHTGWASELQSHHPEYFVRDASGRFESPGAWGVTWADLCRLDYTDIKVHRMMADVFLFWCRRGVDGFRCDAGYMVPEKAWDYIVAKVRSEYPDTVFMLEGLGGPADVQERLLASSGLDWAYSELFQNYSRDEISRYYPYMCHVSRNFGTLVSFAETHDNLRLASTSKTFARLRFLVCGLLALDGAFGFVNGAEFFAAEKIDVHGCGALNFDSPENLNTLISKLNYLYNHAESFGAGASAELIQTGPGNVLALLRTAASGERSLSLINLDCDHWQDVFFPCSGIPGSGFDFLSDKVIGFEEHNGLYKVSLAPGDGYCILFEQLVPQASGKGEAGKLISQRANAMAQRAALKYAGFTACADVSGDELCENPVAFAGKLAGIDPAPVTVWDPDIHDDRREVMIPAGNLLLVRSSQSFRCRILSKESTVCYVESLPEKSGNGEFALVALPENRSSELHILALEISVFKAKGQAEHLRGVLWQLPGRNNEYISFACNGSETGDKYFFAAGNNGAYSLYPADWGVVRSKYDALFAINPETRYPVDRRVLFSSFKAWLVVNDFSQEINSKNLVRFTSGCDNIARWEFAIPAGQGRRLKLNAEMELAADGGGFRISFYRPGNDGDDNFIADTVKARLIIRPDLENRVNHETTKAYAGAEKSLPENTRCRENGFVFSGLDFTVSGGRFVNEPEWHYMNHLSFEANYGQDSLTDRYSPGYFRSEILSGDTAEIIVATPNWQGEFTRSELAEKRKISEIAKPILSKYVVKRDELNTVIAGYPWFLDWGRDTLIVLRGMVKCGIFAESAQIIKAFAAFEKDGTIPNMIRGNDDANRDTSDAPLYLIVATRDYIAASGDRDFPDTVCNGRKLRDILISIVENYRRGTPNGIKMDEKSKLVFSPVHFTWMDTNYPAGTPRQGYPIEIQCLWFAALEFLGFDKLAQEVSESIEKYYFRDNRDFASDCLHAAPGVGAEEAVADDHLRSNQLLAITLGAVKKRELQKKILFSSAELLVPGAIRTLADRKVDYELPIDFRGQRLNDPAHPFWGNYCGPEDTRRKPAYHNGTAWCWPFPAYCEALFMLGGKKVRRQAMAVLLSAKKYFTSGAVGQLPEVADGNAPHREGGCMAQAWSVSEFFRVYEILFEN